MIKYIDTINVFLIFKHMNLKTCIFCRSKHCIKKGKQGGHQRWECMECHKKFQANKTVPPDKEELFCRYVFNKQTLRELKEEYGHKQNYFQEIFDEVCFKEKVHTPRKVALCIDATFWFDFGVVVFRDEEHQENLWWKFVESEQLEHYLEGKLYLQSRGYIITSVTADGFPGLPRIFNGILFQFCHFHARKAVTKYTTRNPKTDAGKEIQYIMHDLKTYTHTRFVSAVREWKFRHRDFLSERTISPNGKQEYTHKRLISALSSILRMSPYLFTYQKNTEVRIPPTTNTLEGSFGHIKVRVSCHRSIQTQRKKKMVHALLLASSVKYTKDLKQKLF
jgi:transposase-like protein